MKITFYFFILLLVLINLNSCFTFRDSDGKILKKTNKISKAISIKYFEHNNISNRYIYYQNPKANVPLLVLIHGAPGSSSALLDFLKYRQLTDNYSMILIDRLGYGYSNYGQVASFREQSEATIALVKSMHQENQEVFIAGHSYGGTIAAVIASLRPEFLTASVLMAPALDPDNEKYFWFSKLGKWKATKWMASGALKVATKEKYNHANDLREWKPFWQKIETPVLHVHGTNDNVVPFVNVAFSKNIFPYKHMSFHIWEGMNHVFPFRKTEETVEIIFNYLSKINRDTLQ